MSGPLNSNFGAGRQTNNTISDGSHNQQFNADVINYNERAETPPSPTHNIPFRRDSAFVSRSELNDIQRKLSVPSAWLALFGLGGVGKSQLAIECCYWVRDTFPDTWVFWVHASSVARFDQDIRNIANDAKIVGRNNKDADVFELVRGWLIDGRKRWMIVLDNADEADFLFERRVTTGNNDGRSRLHYLPVCSHGSVLITTRNRAVAARIVDPCDIVHLKPSEALAISMLKSKLENQEDTGLASLAAILEYMPLAVSQAAAYINKRAPRCTIQEYMRKFEKSEKSRLSLLSSSLTELRRDAEASDSILLTWQISFQHIYDTRQSAADLLSLLSFFDHQGIPEVLARGERGRAQSNDNGDCSVRSNASSDGRAEFEDDIVVLRDYSLISSTPDGHSFEMHRLVQLAAQMWLTKKELYERWEDQALKRLDRMFPWPKYERWPECRSLYTHTRLLLSKKIDRRDASLDLASVLYKSARFAFTQGSYSEAEAAARRSVAVRESILTDADTNTPNSLDMLAMALQYQGKYEAAEEMCRRGVEAGMAVLGAEHPDTLTIMSNLAFTYWNQGRWSEAEELLAEVIEAMNRVLGAEHPDTLRSMSNLALTYWHQERWSEAEELEGKVLEISKGVLGAEHLHTLTIMSVLASTYYNQGRWSEAEELEVEVTETWKRVLGAEHPSTLTSMNNLAVTFYRQRKTQQARQLMTMCVEARIKKLGQSHPDTKVSISWLEIMQSALEEQNAKGAARQKSMVTKLWRKLHRRKL